MKIKHSFSAQLMKIFLISTLLPFILISTFLAQFYSREYEKDIQSLLNSTAKFYDQQYDYLLRRTGTGNSSAVLQ